MQLNAQSMSRYTRNSDQIKGLWFERLRSRIQNIKAYQTSWFSLSFIFYSHAPQKDMAISKSVMNSHFLLHRMVIMNFTNQVTQWIKSLPQFPYILSKAMAMHAHTHTHTHTHPHTHTCLFLTCKKKALSKISQVKAVLLHNHISEK